MADQTEIGVIWSVNLSCAVLVLVVRAEPSLLEHALELCPQHRAHNPAAHVAPAMAANQNGRRLLDVDHVGEVGYQIWGARHISSSGLRHGGMGVVQFVRQEHGPDEGLEICF